MNQTMRSLTRRHFLRFAAGLGAASGLNGLLPGFARQETGTAQTVAQARHPDLISLEIDEAALSIGGRKAHPITANATIPGPLIRLREGQDVTIRVTNHLEEDSSIHWHGILLPANMDGVPGVSYRGIRPGETYVYRFPVRQNGTYWYHSHSGMQEQRGLYGPLIIDPIASDPVAFDREYVVMLSDWMFGDPMKALANLKKRSGYYNNQRLTGLDVFREPEWNRMRMDPTDIADIGGETYTYLMNGLAPADNWTALFSPGERVRLRFINAASMTYFDIRIPGLKMTVVQSDGQNVQPVSVDEFRIAVAETYDVIVEPQNHDAFTIYAETMNRSGYARGTLATQQGRSAPLPSPRMRPLRNMADMGMDHDMGGMAMNHGNSHQSMPGMDHNKMAGMDHGKMAGMGTGSGAVSEVPTIAIPHGPDTHGPGNSAVPMITRSRLNEPGIGLENTGSRVLLYTDLRSLEPRLGTRQPEREIELHLTGNMDRYMWSFDGKKYSQAKEPIRFQFGERLRLTLVNDTMMEHPIHLHGMWMELENGNNDYNPRKHTVNVKPAERLSVNISADAPGEWAFHCHLAMHMESGMFRTVLVSNQPVGLKP